MLEYQDKKFGKVKLVTVTEARANFAALLQDKDTHYIITKNNKPTRVIINYQAFEDLHKKASAIPSSKKSFEHLSGLLEERNEELKSQHEVKEEILVPSDEVISAEEINLPPRHPKNPKGFKEQDVFIEDDIAEDILNVFQSRSDSLAQKNEEEDEDMVSENYFESGDEGDEASILHPEHMGNASLTHEPKEQKTLKTQTAATTHPDAMVETSFPSEADMTPEQKEYFQKYRKLYENSIPNPASIIEEAPEPQKPLPYDDVTREVEKRLAAKWGKNEFKRTAGAMTPTQNSQQAEDEFLAEPISEDPQDPNGLPSLKDLLKDLEQETLSGDDGNKEDMDNGDIDELIHRITHDY